MGNKNDKNEENLTMVDVKKRRPLIISQAVSSAVPYYQYDTERNRKILQALVKPLYNASMIGYDLQDNWEAQTNSSEWGEDRKKNRFSLPNDEIVEPFTDPQTVLDDTLYRLFKIKRHFKNITLTDEQFKIIGDFAQAIRLIDTNNIGDIAKAIEENITDQFALFVSNKEMIYVLFVDTEIIEALVFYKLLPTNVGAKTKLIRIPPEYIGCKLWWWSIVPEGTKEYWLPSIGAYWLYYKQTTPSVLSNPLVILPEWIYTLNY